MAVTSLRLPSAYAPFATLLATSDRDRESTHSQPSRVAVESSLESRALEGDRAAWNALIQTHNRRVVLSLLARGVPADRARDIAQDAWLRLLEQQQRGALTQLVLPGLAISQAMYLALDDARRRSALSKVLTTVSDHEDTLSVDPRPIAEQSVCSSQQLSQAMAALQQCSPTSQNVFLYVYEHPEIPQVEVARTLGLSLQRVRQIVCEVRKHLRAAIEGGAQ